MKAPGHWTVAKLFKGRPASLRLFRVVRSYITSLGPVRIEAGKTQVSFGADRNFAWVWLPQMYSKKRPETSITLTFDTIGKRIRDRRIAEAVIPRPGRWTHHIVIEKPSDVDGTVKKWLNEAYQRVGKKSPRLTHAPKAMAKGNNAQSKNKNKKKPKKKQ